MIMASAKQCDRCKKFYTAPQCNPTIYVVIDYGYFGTDMVDLCESCTQDLRRFVRVDEHGKKEKDDE